MVACVEDVFTHGLQYWLRLGELSLRTADDKGQRARLGTAYPTGDRLCFVCAKDHPLAQRSRADDKPLSLAELCEVNCILPGAKTFTRTLIGQRFEEAGLNLPVSMSTNYLETLKMMCGVGLGWSLLPEKMLDSELVALPVDTAPIHRPLGYLVHNNRTPSNAARKMIEQLEANRET